MTATTGNDADVQAEGELYRDFAKHGLLPLWTQREGQMPVRPTPAAVPHIWHFKLAELRACLDLGTHSLALWATRSARSPGDPAARH